MGRGRALAVKPSTSRGPTAQTHGTARRGTSWNIRPPTACTKPIDRKRPRQGRSTIPLALTSRSRITASVLLRRGPARSRHPPVHTISDSDLSDAETRPHWSNSPPRKAPRQTEDAFPGHHERSAPEFPEPLHGHYESKQASTYTSEPQPSTSRDQTYAWPPTPRDFNNNRAESLANADDKPDYSFSAVIDMIRNFHNIERPSAATAGIGPTRPPRMAPRGLHERPGPRLFSLPMNLPC